MLAATKAADQINDAKSSAPNSQQNSVPVD